MTRLISIHDFDNAVAIIKQIPRKVELDIGKGLDEDESELIEEWLADEGFSSNTQWMVCLGFQVTVE